ncbi:hypothetical protein LIT10_12585, partial [Flavobacterium psychrophilum]|nr:hypothetical protein [Flavobacterium psychrophilum]MCB5998058.1 hypothetical protein [Flavobacterium psychrophilum]MCB6005556.1 hypothetical protein [Flavobacterium psychrophilum]MCB6007976.1 hypothetical protein [Flavobacterium psychrophilum]MCB6020410.1 hypothetical protein [Flavobacterium psychrophilum]
ANVFGNVTQSNCALNVPTGKQVAYQAAAVWRNFSPILGIAQTFTANRIKYTVTSSTAPFTVKVARNANFTGA